MFLANIEPFVDWFVSLMISGVTTTFTLLDSFSFHGISLLDFILAFILIPTGLSIFVAISKASAGAGDLAVKGTRAIKGTKESFDALEDERYWR